MPGCHGSEGLGVAEPGGLGLRIGDEVSSRSDLTPLPLVLVIVGPTGVGKSELAIAVAKRFGGEIVNLDSRQLYRGLEIGTAKPPEEARRSIPHHGFDLLDPEESMSAGAYLEMARRTTREVLGRERLPVFVGGTGFYFRALRQGLSPLPAVPVRLRPVLKACFSNVGSEEAHRWLRVLDPVRAAEVAKRDRDRAIRAIELALSSGRMMSRLLAEPRAGGLEARFLVVGCRRERESLYGRISHRVNEMFESGFVEEVRECLRSGIAPDAPGLSAIGYRDVVAHLEGELDLETTRDRVIVATRQYAKRQITWFRKEPDVVWFDLGDGSESMATPIEKISDLLRQRAGAGHE